MLTTRRDWVGQELDDGRLQINARLPGDGPLELYRAWDRHRAAEVLLKAPRQDLLLADPALANRFAGEIRALMDLSHPHLVQVLDQGEQDGQPYAVIQDVKGRSLRNRQPVDLDNSFLPLPWEDIHGWLGDVADCLDFLHSKNYVHGAVDPVHILFDAKGQTFLSEVSCAQALGTGALPAQQGGMGAEYQAPEVLDGPSPDGRADQYALAVVLYEMLTGKCPFDGKTPAAQLVENAIRKPCVVHERRPALHAGAARAIARALATDPGQRFPSCKAFVQAVARAMETPPPPSEDRPRRLPVIFKFIGWVAIPVVLLAVVGLVVYLATQPRKDTDHRPENVTKPVGDKKKKPVAQPQKPKGLVVVFPGEKRFSTITEALKAAKAGSRLVVHPGEYKGGIVLDKDVEIVGKGARKKIILASGNSPCVTMKTAAAQIRGLTLAGGDDTSMPAVKVGQGDLVLEGCRIVSSYDCVVVSGPRTSASLRKCTISGKKRGVLWTGQCRGTVEECLIEGNTSKGVEIRTGSKVTLHGCQIRDWNLGGVLIHHKGEGTLLNCAITSNYGVGVEVRDTSRATVEGCDLRENQEGPWAISSKAAVVRRGNKQ
jgi:hypothetical protein